MTALDLPAVDAAVVSIDLALIERVRRGDAGAFRELFRSHVARVRRFSRTMLGEQAAADEATQDTFVRAHAAIVGGAAVEKLVPWLLGVARNVAREQLRARKRTVPLDDSSLDATVTSCPDPETLLVGREAHALLARALEGLSDERRAALSLRADQGLGYDDIASILGWNVARVKNEIHRARLQLRAALTAQLEGKEDAR